MSVPCPPIKKGWMKKQGRKGLVKNWKKRYFVLEAGKMFYYVDKIDVPPFGDVLKGELSLANTEIVDEYKKSNDCQIYIVSYNGENNMLMETENLAECTAWIASLKLHCAYADSEAEHGVASLKRNSVQADGSNRTSFPSNDSESSPVPDKRASTSSPVPTNESSPAATTTGAASGSDAATVNKRASVQIPDSKRASVQLPKPSPTAATPAAPVASSEDTSSSDSGGIINPTDFGGLLMDSITSGLSTLTDKEPRDKFLAALSSNVKTTLSSLLKNIQEGEMGKRGEEWFIGLFVLSFLILVGVHPLLFRLISFFIWISAFLYILLGLFLIANALWELKANISPFIAPIKDNTLTTGGVYRLCRHPMYGGLILLCIGKSIRAGSMEKFLLSVVLAFILDNVSQIEESLLNKTHPKKYKEYANNKKKLIPLFY